MNEVVSLISNVGFPMAMTLIMMWYVYDSNESHAKQIAEITEKHEKEVNKMIAVLEDNTIVLEKLSDRLEGVIK